MDFEIIEEEKNKIKILFKGERSTVFELLRKRLYENEDVVIAGYKILHPMEDKIEFYLETKKENAREILISTLKRIISEVREFREVLEKVL